jgi:hypothetical protein
LHRLAFTNARFSAFARDVFERIGFQPRRTVLPFDIGKHGSHRGRLLQSPYFVRLHDTAATTYKIDIPTAYGLLGTNDFVVFFRRTLRILATI